jgi:hypothetical protein
LIALKRMAATVAGSAALMAGAAMAAASAGAATAPAPLPVTLSGGSGGSATWAGLHSIALAVGSDTSHTYAQVTINGVSGTDAPGTAPELTTDNYAAGSPRLVIDFANGYWLVGYPSQANVTGGWEADGPGGYYKYGVDYATALGDVGASHTTVSRAYVVADGDQAAGTTDTVTLTYNGQQPTAQHGDITTAVNHNYCLDTYSLTAGANVDLYPCWSGDTHQDFAAVNGELQAVGGDPAAPLCVTETAGNDRLSAEACTGASSQQVTRSGQYYVFRDGRVLNDSGYSLAWGNNVLAYQQVSTTNEQWSQP